MLIIFLKIFQLRRVYHTYFSFQYIYIYIYIYVCVCVCVCVFTEITIPEWQLVFQIFNFVHPQNYSQLCATALPCIKCWCSVSSSVSRMVRMMAESFSQNIQNLSFFLEKNMAQIIPSTLAVHRTQICHTMALHEEYKDLLCPSMLFWLIKLPYITISVI
jgi:hypothetical protein